MCHQAHRSASGCGKPLLAILDCCFSTAFVRDVLSLVDFPVRAAFLTSAREDCQASATVVSRDPTLVYPCPIDQSSPPPKPRTPAGKPAKTPKPTAPGESPEKSNPPSADDPIGKPKPAAPPKRPRKPKQAAAEEPHETFSPPTADDTPERPKPAASDKRAKKPKQAAAEEPPEQFSPPAADELTEKPKPAAPDKRARKPKPAAADETPEKFSPPTADEPTEKPKPAAPDKRAKKPKQAAPEEPPEQFSPPVADELTEKPKPAASDERAKKPKQAAPGHAPASPRAPLVFGYRVQHAMLSRVLVPLLTYVLSNDITLAQLPAMMNHPMHPMKFGFEAELLHTTPPDDADWVNTMPVRFFFPWAPINPDTISVAAPKEPFRNFITVRAVGELYDDISHFWLEDGDERRFALVFVEIERVRKPTGQIEILATRRGWFNPEDPDENRIRKHVKASRASGPRCPTPLLIPAPPIPRYPLPEISNLFFQRAEARRLPWYTGTVDPQWVEEFNAFIRTLNVPIAISDMRAIIHMAHFGCLMDDQDEFRQMVRDARDAIVAEQPPAADE
jgi:hypothetical protein